MIKIAHEAPKSIFSLVESLTSYSYGLVHLFEEDEEYYNQFKQIQSLGRDIILDNSIFELGTAFDADRYAYWIDKLRPSEYILPDALEDCDKTIENAEYFLKHHKNLPGRTIGVVQGKNLADIIYCYNYLDKKLNVDKLAISFDYSLYQRACPHPNKWMAFANGRTTILAQLLAAEIINKDKPHHLLGCSVPAEFISYQHPEFSWIESLDTSNPVVAGILGERYQNFGLLDKSSIKLADMINHEVTVDQINNIKYNINLFKQLVNGSNA